MPPTLWIRGKVLAFLFASVGELYSQRSEDSIRWVSESCGHQWALKCMLSNGNHLSPEDHTESTLLKLAPWIYVGSFMSSAEKTVGQDYTAESIGLGSWDVAE